MNNNKSENVNKTNSDVVKILKTPSTYVFKPEIVKVTTKKPNKNEEKNGELCRLFSKGNWNINETNKKRDIINCKCSRSLFLAHDHSNENIKLSKTQKKYYVSKIKQIDNNENLNIIEKNHNTNLNYQSNKNPEWSTRNPQEYYLPNYCSDKKKDELNKLCKKNEIKESFNDNIIGKKKQYTTNKCHSENYHHESMYRHQSKKKNTNDDVKSAECRCNKISYRQDSPYPSGNNILKKGDLHGYPYKLNRKFDRPNDATLCSSSKCCNIKNNYIHLNGVVAKDNNDDKTLELFDDKIMTNMGNVLCRSRSLPQLSNHDSGVVSGQENALARPNSRLVADLRQLLTLKQHYYPEGGWGWIIVIVGVLVQILSHGIHGAVGVTLQNVMIKFNMEIYRESGWLGAMSTGVALLVSPVTIAFCRRKSTRLTAVFGGLITALGCLFTSFASQFHQLFFSYGTVVGIGVGMTRDCSTLMVAQYFKRKREFVEIFIVSGSGLGIAVMSAFIKGAVSKNGWRLGLQAVTVVVLLTFFLGTFYRSASLYHPQRRAILHLKNQKRKIKDKNKIDDRPPFFDFSTLKSKTVRILLLSTGISAFGINTPIFYLAHQAEEEGLGDTVVVLQAYLGLAWTLGCVCFGLLVVHHSVECRIARQYLTQAAVFMCGLCILALTAVHGNYNAYVMFTWIYGIFCGGYHYSLKMYTYERVRARNFAKTWGFVQCSQAIPIAIGVPISGYMNIGCGGKAGYYFSSTCVLVGSFTLFFIDLHKRNLSRHKHTRSNGTKHLCVAENCPQRRRLSFSQEPDNDGTATGGPATALVMGTEISPGQGEMIDALGVDKPELTCISEEGIADMDLPDNILDDLDYIGDCITSCNKVENYLMLSEFENNLIAEMPIIMDRKGRRWSLARSKGTQGSQGGGNNNANKLEEDDDIKPKWQLMATPNNRLITVIDEASTSHIEG